MELETPAPGEVTLLLRRLRRGDAAVGDQLAELVYRELHALARRVMTDERGAHVLQPTALVHEAWLRLLGAAADGAASDFEDRTHFLRLAARAMRRVLVDHARARDAEKRGGGRVPAQLELAELDLGALSIWDGDRTDVLALDDALAQLESRDPDAARVVELRFFAGLTTEETARALGWTVRQVEGSWVFARGWLRRELERGAGSGA
ncbi:MAG: sigma-70 family RNA polymerase sigma factor [Planctomycetota bacterium]|nr:MAG: sigma-70 family RNA polymerase sigma factor [Planctomycetota bacterium]